jgi:hypothetical protein
VAATCVPVELRRRYCVQGRRPSGSDNVSALGSVELGPPVMALQANPLDAVKIQDVVSDPLSLIRNVIKRYPASSP